MIRIYDALFINQLLGKNQRGDTIYYPNGKGKSATGYLVPPGREAGLRRSLRTLTLASMISVFAVILLTRAVENILGYTIPLPWFAAGAAVFGVAVFFIVVPAMKRLAVGLEPVTAGT